MKHLACIFSLFFSTFYSAALLSQGSNYSPISSCPNYNAFTRNGKLEGKDGLYASRLSNTAIYLDSQKSDSTEYLYKKMELDSGTTFVFVRETTSRLSEKKIYKSYQQFYNGVLVEGGGYTTAHIGPGGTTQDPCIQGYLLAPRILTGISLSTIPNIQSTEIADILDVEKVHDMELVITHNMTNQCEFNLAWKVTFTKENQPRISWINAQNSEIIKTVDISMGINAPTETYGTQNLNDRTVGNTTTLESPDQRIKIYNFESNQPEGIVNLDEWTNDLIPSTFSNQWTNEAPSSVYQALYVTTLILPVYEALGVHFENVNVASGTFINALSLAGSTVDNAYIGIGEFDGTLALFDITAHELGHTYLHDFLDSTEPGNRSLHEGIADMLGTYVESVINGNVDWIMADDNFAVNMIGRDLANPGTNVDCFTEVSGFGALQVHERSKPLGHWFYLISQGNQSHNIPALGIQQAINIVIDALSLIGRKSDYPDLMEATLTVVEDEFGICSNEFFAVARAWEAICVPTGLANVNGVINCNFTLTAPNQVCEEDGYLQICINGGLANAHYRWYVLSSSLGFESTVGIEGNIQEGGNCLTLIDFPEFPFYPQNITIKVYSPTVGPQFIQKKNISIIDCDGDDPSCKEYYESFNSLEERENSNRSDGLSVNTESPYRSVKVFDYTGRIIYEENTELFKINSILGKGLIFIVYYGNSGEIVNVQKYFSGLN